MEKRLQRKASFIQAVRKQSAVDSDKPKETRKTNTYRLEPKNPFKPEPVYRILEEVMTQGLEGITYEPDNCAQLAMTLSAEIRSRVKALNNDRYKLICTVEIIEKKMQGIRMVAKFLWDHERDNYAFFKYENYHLVGVGYVFGIYLE